MFTATLASRTGSSIEGGPGPGAGDGVEETRLRSVLEDKGTGWLRRCGRPPDEVLSLAVPTLLQHKLLVHLMAPEVQAGPWQRVLGYEKGALWTLGQPT